MHMESGGYILVREVQRGNQAAFEQLVHAHDQAVLRLALRITGSESDAQEIHQEAFLRVYIGLAGFRFECSLSTWIYRIVARLCLNHLRRNRKHAGIVAFEGNVRDGGNNLLNQLHDDSATSDTEQQLLAQELSAHISSALRILTPDERMVFELKQFQGLKLRTVARILNASEASTKCSLFQATRKVRDHLAILITTKQEPMKGRVIAQV
jgi:RNA polymerase sigma-70 factor, ECF subfamily